MTHFLVTGGLLVAGILLGGLIARVFEFLKNVPVPLIGIDALRFSAETLYLAALFCAPLSGNLVLSLLLLSMMIYSLFGGFGSEYLSPLKPEDKVDSKWFPKYP